MIPRLVRFTRDGGHTWLPAIAYKDNGDSTLNVVAPDHLGDKSGAQIGSKDEWSVTSDTTSSRRYEEAA